MPRKMIAVEVTYASELRRSYDVEVRDGPGWEERARAAATKLRESGAEADGWDESTPEVSIERQD
jgi:hypothetical protein